MFTVMHRRQVVLAIEYFQIILMLLNNELSCIFYLTITQNSFLSLLIISNLSMVIYIPYFSNTVS